MAQIVELPNRTAPPAGAAAPEGALEERAPAKINLALHVVGRRGDGYHLIESLVVFADLADRLTVRAAETDSLTVCGPFAADLAAEEVAPERNLVARARDRLRAHVLAAGGTAPPVAVHLEKNLPVAAGIGGGSADAAAALRGLCRLWGVCGAAPVMGRIAVTIGADVPMCLVSAPLIARGIGEAVAPLDAFPALHLVLVNPRVRIATPDVFAALATRQNPPIGLPPATLAGGDPQVLARLRNDLEAPASALAPAVAAAMDALRESGSLLARMSGSGATCFGLFPDAEAAAAAAARIGRQAPHWFVAACRSGAGTGAPSR